ncbi:MAG: DUF6607 family protein [Pseudomonadota bacterium]
MKRRHPFRHAFAVILATALCGCAARTTVVDPTQGISDVGSPTAASEPIQTPNPRYPAIAQAEGTKAKDRAAILAMQGDYGVKFHFQETVALEAGYELEEDKNSGANETVLVVVDEPDHIVLQHILVTDGGYVIKHWRQDWTWQAAERFEFVSDQTWARRPLPQEQTSKAWTQCVYEVSDAPRYCGTGRWDHRHRVSTWTSDQTSRPLPRREYTKRDDYNVLQAINRHTVTPNGWTHEQDNTKTVRDGETVERMLVREHGFNDYRSLSGFDFSPAHTYWSRTHEYWSRVRAAWDVRLKAAAPLVINTEVDGMPIIQATFGHAEKVEDMSVAEQLTAIESVLNEWVEPAINASHPLAEVSP